MKFLGWYSFGLICLTILYWLPDLFSNSAEVDTAIGVIALYSPVAIYIYKKVIVE